MGSLDDYEFFNDDVPVSRLYNRALIKRKQKSRRKVHLAITSGRYVKTLCNWATEKKNTTKDINEVTCLHCIRKSHENR